MTKCPVLIFVDDEADLKGLYQIFLSHAFSMEIKFEFFERARDCISFLEKMEIADSPVIVVTDIDMPDIDGYGLLTYIRENFRNVDVVISSGFDEEEKKEKAYELGALDYIIKPVDFTKLSTLFKLKSV